MTRTIEVEINDAGEIHPISSNVVCQITSNPKMDAKAIPLVERDFLAGGLHHVSYLRPGKIFTAHESLIASTLGVLQPSTFQRARDAVLDLIRSA